MTDRILVYLETFLPPSQAFVAKQARSIEQFHINFLANRKIASPLEGLSEFSVGELRSSLRGRMAELILKVPRLAVPQLMPVKAPLPSLIHAHFGKNGYVIYPFARAIGIPLLITFHGFDATFEGKPREAGGFNQVRYFHRGRAELAKKPDVYCVAVSRFIKDRLIALGFEEARIFQHYIGVDTDYFTSSDRKKPSKLRIVCVSRFIEYKGHRHIIEALKVLASTGVPFEIVFVGDGPLSEEMSRLAAKSLASFRIVPQASQAAIRELLDTSHIYLHGSVTLPNGHSEALGISLLEAQAMGLPVVAFRSGGVPEIVRHGETGLLCEERDTSAMAGHLKELHANTDLRERLGRQAAQMARREFGLTNQTRSLEGHYAKILQHHRAQAA